MKYEGYYNEADGDLIVNFDTMEEAKAFAKLHDGFTITRCGCKDCCTPLAYLEMSEAEAIVFAAANDINLD